jgi:hypothetical protein
MMSETMITRERKTASRGRERPGMRRGGSEEEKVDWSEYHQWQTH